MSTNQKAQKPANGSSASGKKSKGFTDIEKEAMKNRAQEAKAEARLSKNRAEGEKACLGAINAMKEPDRSIAKRIHALVTSNAPDLWPKTWYGMPAYAKDGKPLCFYQSGQKFKTRYATFGFTDSAKLDEGNMWPVGFAVKQLTAADEAKIIALVKKAVK
jgi:uncharacterized protein YdhG (YjbR/CyaY superfamily)